MSKKVFVSLFLFLQVRPYFEKGPFATLRLIGPPVYRFEGGRIVVQPGFHSDLASIPASLRWLVGKLEAHASAAVLHDYLYATALMPRAAADHLFLEAMTNSGVGRIKRRAMFAAVRIFGRFYWR